MDTKALTMREKQLDTDLKKLDFIDQEKVDALAKRALDERIVRPEDFNVLYDRRKPKSLPEWSHSNTVKLIDELSAEHTEAGNSETVLKLKQDARELRELINAQANEQTNTIENNGPITESRITGTDLDKRFTIKNDRYYLKDTNKEAFRDTGKKIIVKPESRKVVAADVVKLADSKGWTAIKVTGNDEFKREVWKEAHTRGIDVQGYTPTEQDKRDLDSQLNAIEAAPRADKPKAVNQAIAPDKSESMGDAQSENPEVAKRKLPTQQKAELKAKPETPAAKKDIEQLDQQSQDTHKTENPEIAKRHKTLARAFKMDSPSKAVKNHPELEPVYQLRNAAMEFGTKSIRVTRYRNQFVAAVVARGIDELAHGNPLPDLQPAQPTQTPDRSAEVER